MKRVSIVFLVAALAATSFISAAEKVVTFQEGEANQFVVLKDRTLPVLGELQEKYPRGSKPEMHVVDYRDGSRTTREYFRRKPPNDKYPYFFLVANDGLILAQGELAEKASDNVELIEKFQEKPDTVPSSKVSLNADVSVAQTPAVQKRVVPAAQPTSVPKQGEQKSNVYSFEGWKAGSYSLSLVIGESGEIVSVSALTVISVPAPSTTPVDPPPPAERIKRIKAVVPDDKETAKNIAGLSNVLATKARAGEFQTIQQLSDTFKMSLNLLLEDSLRSQKWAAMWKKTAAGSEGVLANEWIAVAQRGGAIADYAALLDDVATALGGSSQLEAFDIATITELVGIIMKGDLKLADFVKIAELILRLFS